MYLHLVVRFALIEQSLICFISQKLKTRTFEPQFFFCLLLIFLLFLIYLWLRVIRGNVIVTKQKGIGCYYNCCVFQMIFREFSLSLHFFVGKTCIIKLRIRYFSYKMINLLNWNIINSLFRDFLFSIGRHLCLYCYFLRFFHLGRYINLILWRYDWIEIHMRNNKFISNNLGFNLLRHFLSIIRLESLFNN